MKKIKIAYIIWGCLLIVILGLLTYLGFMYQKKIEPYKMLEKELINVAEKYVEQEFLYPEDGEIIKITFLQLYKKGLIKELIYKNDKCDGYVKLKYNGVYEYNAYIRCSKYITKDY